MRYFCTLLLLAFFGVGMQAQTTFNVDMTCAPEGFSNVFVTGPWCGWCSNSGYNTMTDPDGDGIYSVSVADLSGTVEYKYAINDFADQENLINDMQDGASCAPVTDYSGYANRQIEANGTANDYYGSCDGTCNDAPAPSPVNVTFQVDMSQYAEGYVFSGVFVNGGFNGWCGACNPLADNGNGIWSVTLPLDPGTIEYKFTLDGWNYQEEFAGGEACTSTIDGFTNRSLTFDAETVLPAVCWESCDVCPDIEDVLGCMDSSANNYNAEATAQPDNACLYDVTLSVDVSQTSFTAVSLAGTFNGWNNGSNFMNDNGDGTYSITVSMTAGAQEYKFLGNGDWGVAEQFDGSEACTTAPGEYVNRVIDVNGPTTADLVCYNSCEACVEGDIFGCTDASANNYNADATSDDNSCLYNTTFNVDMSCAGVDFYEVFVTGPLWGWPANSGFNQLLDADGDGIYSVTIETPAGDIEYKYAVDGWADQENLIDDMQNGASCAPVTDYNGYANRLAASGSSTSDTYGSCDACPEEAFSIQAAIDQAAEGATIEIPAGDYHESLVINKGLVLTSASGAQDVNLYPPSGTGISIQDGPDNVVVSNLTIVGNELVGSGITVSPGASNIQLANNSISNILLPGGGNSSPLSYGILVWGDSDPVNPPTGITIENNSISNVLGSAISLGSNTVDVTIAGNVFSEIVPVDFGGTPLAIGIQAELCAGLEISSNEYNDLLQATSLVNCSGVELVDNSYNNISLLLLTTWPHDIALDAEPWWSTTLSADGVNLSEAYFSNPSDPTYLYFASLGMFSQSSSNPGCTDSEACNFNAESLSDDGSCDYPDSELVDCDGNCLAAIDCAGECGGSAALDGCGVCGGDGSSCTGCADPAASNYDEGNTIADNGQCVYLTTFNVDMTCAPEGFSNVFVTGPWCGWCSNSGYNTMTDPDGDGIYSVSVADLSGTVEYKYAINDFADQENLINDMQDGASCAPVTDYSGYANRQIEANGTANDYYGSCDGTCNDAPAPSPVNVTFQVDMSQYAEGYVFSGVFVNGGFNGWCGACNPLADNGNGIWSVTLPLDPGTIEYKFTLDGWNYQEEFAGGEACTSTIDGFTNRSLTFDAETVLPAVCWESCDVCPDIEDVLGCMDSSANNYNAEATAQPDNACLYDVTLSVDVSQTSFTAVSLAGTFNGWNNGSNFMNDNGDGTYSITVSMTAGAQEYKFLGNGDWGVAEQFDGSEACTTAPGEYVNRVIDVNGPTTADLVCYNSCEACVEGDIFGCTDASANNYNADATSDDNSCLYNTTFNVDMSCAGVDFYEVFVTGPLWGWPANSGFNQLLDADGDGIYSVTIETPAGDIEYKYAVDGWADQENLIDDMQNGASCAPVTDYNGYANRLAASGSSTSDTYGSCDACPEDVLGCTDEAACNFNADATLDDGSCEAADDLTGCGDTCLDGGILYEFNISDVYSDGMCCAYGEGSYSIVVDGEVIATGGDFGASATERFCAPAEACVQIVMVADNYPSEQSWSVTADGVEVLGAGLNGATATYYLGGCQPGCTDEAACNYDDSANVDDDSCLELDACGECGGSGVDTDGDGVCDAEEIAGCQDEAACNYNPAATDPAPASGLSISLSAGSWPSEISWTLNGESYGAPFDGLIELAPGMYTLEGADSYGDGWNGAQMTIVDAVSGATVSFSVSGSSGSIEVEVTGAEGCTYAPEFYQCDGETCVNDVDGDGVCDELEIDGCVVPTACNYDVNATNLVPCVYPEPGYTCDGECDGDADGDGICDANEIAGCQDEGACNYNPDATDPAAINGLTISLSAGSWPSEISWTLNGESYGAPFDGFVELAPGVYTLEGADSYGDGWNGAEMTLVDASSGASTSFSVSGSAGSIEIEVTGAEGCDFESCLGCTDASACNYSSDATQEDGSCDYCSCVSGTVGGSNGFGLSVETYAEGGVLGTTTYRVYVTTPNEDDFVSAITGDENNPSFLRTSTSFYQNDFGGLTADQSNPFLFSVFPELAYDSWVTIGIDQAPVPGDGNGAISLVQADGDSWVEDFEAGGNLEINSFFGGSWFTTILDDNGVAGADKKVLLAQLTTDGTLTGQLYVQVFPEGNGENAEYLTLSFGNSSCGCTDEAACNYSDSALYDDGSCDYLSCTGCTDAAACNYEEGATVEDGSCVYPEAYLDCDGNCMNDANINGICDELEVLGCTYAAACNYNMDANVDDGQCDFSCIPTGCQGTDVVQGCTVPEAGNYDPAATCDNGSCVFSNGCRADLDDDGVIGMGDLLEYLSLFGSSCE
ncbi:MAG: hypothetical protein ACPHX0_07195 [Flavobacteriales bacterium]